MRRIFDQRARLVVYVESGDADRMEKRARGEGKTLVEWMRETLLAELEGAEKFEGNYAAALQRVERVRVAERGAGKRRGRSTVIAGGSNLEEHASTATVSEPETEPPHSAREINRSKYCAHGTQKGYRCWQCAGLAIIE